MQDQENQEEKLSVNILKYNNIMRRYRNGEFGDKHLSLAEILEAAGEEDLLDNMNIEELKYLIRQSIGLTKMLFLARENEIRNSKNKREDLGRTLKK